MDKLILSPIMKATPQDDGSLLVEGVATSEAVDAQNEIVDYGSAKEAFAKWRGNVREMHSDKAVGRALAVIPSDDDKQVFLRAFVSKGAPDTQAKVLDGTLSYFSIGGRAAKRAKDGEATRVYLDRLSEVSLVDSGANPDSRFQIVKADGEALVGVGLEELPEEQVAETGENPDATATKMELDYGASAETSDAARALQALSILETLIVFESNEEHPEPPEQIVQLRAAVAQIKAFIASEIQEPAPGEGEMAAADAPADVEKATDWQAQHDESVKNGATCASSKADDPPPDVQKDVTPEPASPAGSVVSADQVEKLAADMTALSEQVATLKADATAKAEEADTLRKQVDDLKAKADAAARRVIEPGAPVYKGGDGRPTPINPAAPEGASPIPVEKLMEIVRANPAEADLRKALAAEMAVEMTKRVMQRAR